MAELTDREIVLLYREWSEDIWAAGFIDATPLHVANFRLWIVDGHTELEDYELAMVAEYRKQVEASP